MNLEDLAKQTINEVSTQIEEQKRQLELLKKQEEEKLQQEKNELEKEQNSLEMQDFEVKEIEESSNEISNDMIKEQIHKAKSDEEEKILQATSPITEQIQTQVPEVSLQTEILNPSIINEVQNLNEDIFLRNLRERILVLFEGLNSIKKEELEQKLHLTINFLEFLLANIEDKLKK